MSVERAGPGAGARPSPRTLALGRSDSLFYRSIRHELHRLGVVAFRDERALADGAAIVQVVREGAFARVLMPNPYGNARRLECYRTLRAAEIPVIASDRGALPGSWFFDVGFNYDSPSYGPDAWDRPLTTEQRTDAAAYIAAVRSSRDALEAQGPRRTTESLRATLGLGGARVLFVPLQRAGDSVVRYFAGAAGSMDGLVALAERTLSRLEREAPGDWALVLKKHPLERTRISITGARACYAPDDTHVHDLLELADAVMALNSGVGLLSLCFDKPTFHAGKAFYGHPGLSIAAERAETVAQQILAGQRPDREKVERFVHHLTTRVYSFGTSETDLRKSRDGSQRVTTRIEFRSLRVLGEELPVGGDRVLIVSPVIPTARRRGSEARVDAMIRALIARGARVSLAVLDSGVEHGSPGVVADAVRRAYPEVECVEVVQHPRFDRSARGRIAHYGACAVDLLLAGPQRIDNLETCPPRFRHLVGEMCERIRPHVLFVNYAKLAPVVPPRFAGISVLDTHDYQTRFLREDQVRNRRRRHVSARVFGWSERRALRRFDRLLAINPSEQREFERLAPGIPVSFVPGFSEARYVASDPARGFRYEALLVASRSSFNLEGLRWLAERVMPIVLRARPDFRVMVAGNIDRTKALRGARFDGIEMLGVVPELEPLYQEAACVVAPLLGGAGMKIKVVEALAHAKAIVATPAAFEGIRAIDGVHALVGATPEAFAAALLRAVGSAELRTKLEEGARALHARDHSPEAVASAIDAAFHRG